MKEVRQAALLAVAFAVVSTGIAWGLARSSTESWSECLAVMSGEDFLVPKQVDWEWDGQGTPVVTIPIANFGSNEEKVLGAKGCCGTVALGSFPIVVSPNCRTVVSFRVDPALLKQEANVNLSVRLITKFHGTVPVELAVESPRVGG